AAFAAAARLAHRQGDYGIARGPYQASLAVAMALENERGIARALEGLGSVALYQQDDLIVARQFYEQALTTYRAIDDRPGIASALLNLSDVLYEEGDCYWATLAEESLQLFRE